MGDPWEICKTLLNHFMLRLTKHLLDISILKHLLALCLLIFGSAYGQSSHRDLTIELLKDLQRAVVDSTLTPQDRLSFQFGNDSNLGMYLNTCISNSPDDLRQAGIGLIELEAIEMTMAMNQESTKTIRNSRYLRQLELQVSFKHDRDEYIWQGKISDKVSKTQLKKLLDEAYPITAEGDYSSREPAISLIVLTTLGVFSLGIALFFIRT